MDRKKVIEMVSPGHREICFVVTPRIMKELKTEYSEKEFKEFTKNFIVSNDSS
jgi:hypothetical protein